MPNTTYKIGKGKSGIVLELIEGMNQAELTASRRFWDSLATNGSKLRSDWANLGKQGKLAKDGLNGNTKLFGKWRDKTYPGITASIMSKSILLYAHYESIEKWAEKNSVRMNHPDRLVRAYQKDKNVKLNQDGTVEKKAVKKEPASDSAEQPKDTSDNGIEGFIATLTEAANKMVAIERDHLQPKHITALVSVSNMLANYIKGNEVNAVKISKETQEKFLSDKRKSEIKKELKSELKAVNS